MKKSEVIEQATKRALKKLRSKLYKIFGCRSISVIEHFAGIVDPRNDQGKRHSPNDLKQLATLNIWKKYYYVRKKQLKRQEKKNAVAVIFLQHYLINKYDVC